MKAFLDRHPRLKSLAKPVWRVFRRPGVSDNYVPLDATDAARVWNGLQNAWQDAAIPLRQRSIVEAELRAFRAGAPVPVFDSFVEVLGRLPATGGESLLEIGCSSGYYSEVLAARGLDVKYRGCDYSEAFIELARRSYPNLPFDVMDATQLGYESDRFDIVVSGCCLLHILDYPSAIAETGRVARHYAIFHRTPVLQKSATRHFTKDAYGVKTIEIHFNEKELVRLFAQNRLQVVDILTIDAGGRNGDAFAVKTYVCRKVPA